MFVSARTDAVSAARCLAKAAPKVERIDAGYRPPCRLERAASSRGRTELNRSIPCRSATASRRAPARA